MSSLNLHHASYTRILAQNVNAHILFHKNRHDSMISVGRLNLVPWHKITPKPLKQALPCLSILTPHPLSHLSLSV